MALPNDNPNQSEAEIEVVDISSSDSDLSDSEEDDQWDDLIGSRGSKTDEESPAIPERDDLIGSQGSKTDDESPVIPERNSAKMVIEEITIDDDCEDEEKAENIRSDIIPGKKCVIEEITIYDNEEEVDKKEDVNTNIYPVKPTVFKVVACTVEDASSTIINLVETTVYKEVARTDEDASTKTEKLIESCEMKPEEDVQNSSKDNSAMNTQDEKEDIPSSIFKLNPVKNSDIAEITIDDDEDDKKEDVKTNMEELVETHNSKAGEDVQTVSEREEPIESCEMKPEEDVQNPSKDTNAMSNQEELEDILSSMVRLNTVEEASTDDNESADITNAARIQEELEDKLTSMFEFEDSQSNNESEKPFILRIMDEDDIVVETYVMINEELIPADDYLKLRGKQLEAEVKKRKLGPNTHKLCPKKRKVCPKKRKVCPKKRKVCPKKRKVCLKKKRLTSLERLRMNLTRRGRFRSLFRV